ncbi:MAG: cysteine hydrolase [Chloroflexi bacterium]|nr:cysteine hydrolase [Chloroflexota bacterium]
MNGKLAQWLSAGPAAVIVVDVQNDFCHEEGASGRRGEDMSMAQAAAARLEAFVEQVRPLGVSVVRIRTTHGPWTDAPSWVLRRREGAPPVCREGTWGTEFYGFTPAEGDRVVTKHRYSAFIGTDLDLTLRSLGVKVLLIGGVATDVCVESTVRDGYMLDYHTITLSDCSGTYDQAAHDAALRTLDRYFGLVAESASVLAALRELAEARMVTA